jgi:3'-phosphoadenosine 5'-phosphosulfate sulfotransferase (PAPS reductase)/FAD synthetase
LIYIVNVSGGLTSYEALRRTIAKHGRENVRAVFADTRIEDPDLYRFLDDIEAHLGVEIVRLADGRTPFEVWRDARAITLRGGGGAGAAPCSRVLKREVIERWVQANFEPGTYTRVIGYSWDEQHRMYALIAIYAPDPVWFPLAERPFMDKCHIADQLEAEGIKAPALYEAGFAHNNCGGGCVKAGQAHFAHLLRQRPEVYARWEQEEADFRAWIGKDVAILNDRRGGGPRKPLTLADFRARVEAGEPFENDEWGGCGCFAPTVQGRFDDLLLEA